MRIFVTGGSGFVGREILRQIHARGWTARVLARDPEAPGVQALRRQYDLEVHPGNVLDGTSLEPGLAEVDAVVHLVGIISEVGRNTFENVHALGSANTARAARQAGIRRFIHMSALGTRPGAPARYHQSKWAGEEAVRRSGLAATIFRPSIIYGPEDKFVNLFDCLARFSPVIPIMGSGRARLQPIAVEAVTKAFLEAVVEPAAEGQSFDLCGAETLALETIIDQTLAVSGRKRIKWHVPPGLARAMAATLEFAWPRFLRRAPPLNRDQLIMLQEDNIGDPEPARRLFGLELEPFRDGIARYL